MSYDVVLFCVVALALGRTGMYGRNNIRLVDSERDTHQNIAVDDYVGMNGAHIFDSTASAWICAEVCGFVAGRCRYDCA
jgi:hypothetical protein